MQKVSIVVVDDHPVVLRGLLALLEADNTFRVAASFTDAVAAIDLILNLKPDIALVDMNMPRLHGLHVLRAVVTENLPTRIVFLAASPSDKEIVAAISGGAYGLVLKETAPDTLITSLHAVASGQKCLPDDLVDGALKRTRDLRAQIAGVEDVLTRREMEVMFKVADGLSNKEVGSQLNISEGTVKIHLNSIYHKIGVGNRTSLVNFAIGYLNKLSSDKGLD
jgi:two-component system nitrate/nitrite response regulator NarL